MDILEKLNKAFADWYESWFGDEVGNIRPKDVLRKILNAMEDNRKEGLDNKIYVPNKYIIEISFDSEEEREYLLAFLEKEELESAMRKYMAQSKYYVRGPLDLTIEEVNPTGEDSKPEKLKIKCRWDVKNVDSGADVSAWEAPIEAGIGEEEYTVASSDIYDASTVAPPILKIKNVDGTTKQFRLTKPNTTIGRSRKFENDLVIEKDGMISKRHAAISMSAEGFVITDLNSTNGLFVNEEKTQSAVLKSGDVIRLGGTELVFEETKSTPAHAEIAKAEVGPRAKLIIINDNGSEEEFMLGSETTIGRYLSCDLRLDDPSIASQHAKVYREKEDYYIENDDGEDCTFLNTTCLEKDKPAKLRNGDKILLGKVNLRFELE
jgi:pSer/pThr/pTyr-binding forkhead associated (FHA) protein/uncharacterized protein YnzC (UPF0291/DUF896 family)